MPEIRQQILDATVTMVAEDGVRAVSFREVARRAGVSHQAPYHHFGDHRGILAAIAQQGFGDLADAMRAAADGTDDSLGALRAAGVAYVEFAMGHVGHFRVMFQQTLDPGALPLEEALRTHGVLVELAERTVAAGYGRGLSADLVAGLCWSTAHGFATLAVEGILAGKAPLDPAEVVGAMAELLAP